MLGCFAHMARSLTDLPCVSFVTMDYQFRKILKETENYKELRKREGGGCYLKGTWCCAEYIVSLAFPADLCESHYSRCVRTELRLTAHSWYMSESSSGPGLFYIEP